MNRWNGIQNDERVPGVGGQRTGILNDVAFVWLRGKPDFHRVGSDDRNAVDLQRLCDCPSRRAREDSSRTKQRIVLVKSRVAPAVHLDIVRSVRQAGENDGRGNGRLGAPGVGVEPPLVMSEAAAVGPAARRNSKTSSHDADD